MNGLINKYIKMPIQIKAVFWLSVCSLLQKGISIITVPLFTRIMTADDYGSFSVFISWENILQLFTSLSLHTGVFNTAMIQNENRHNVVISAYLGLTTLITSIFIVIYLPLQHVINPILGMNSAVVCLLFVNLLLSPALNLWIAKNRFEYKYRRLVVYTLLYSVLNPLTAYVVVMDAVDKSFARIVTTTIVSGVFYGIIYIIIFMNGRVFFDAGLWKNALIVNIPLIPHFLSGTILNQADRLMISKMAGDSAAGIYSVGYSAAMLLQILISSVNASIIPWFYSKLKQGKEEETRGVLNIASILMAGAVLIFMLFAPECMKILASDEYYQAVWIFPSLTASIFFIYLYNLFCNIELYFERSIYITVSSCMAAGINIILNYVWIPVYGYTAAGYTTLISYIVYAGMHYIFAKKIMKEKHLHSPIDVKFILLLTVIVLIAAGMITYMYSYVQQRYLAAAVLFMTAFIFRRKVLSLLKEVRHR